MIEAASPATSAKSTGTWKNSGCYTFYETLSVILWFECMGALNVIAMTIYEILAVYGPGIEALQSQLQRTLHNLYDGWYKYDNFSAGILHG